MIAAVTLSVFVPTFFLVSLTPGMCMTLAMVLGMTQGVRRALWMMVGELTGVALVAVSAGAGVAALMLAQPALFTAFKWLGGAYLAYLGIIGFYHQPNSIDDLIDFIVARILNQLGIEHRLMPRWGE